LTPPAQAKLLRLLQEQEVRPVGSTQAVKVNVRILAATNRDLEQVIKDGSFRDDLYYRLKVVTIRVPPLRERKSDILPLARHFVAKYALQPVSVSDTVVERFLDYPLPGNVRELENTVRRMVALQSKSVLREKDLPTAFQRHGSPRSNGGDEAATILPLSEIERRHILRAVEHAKGDLQAAAHLLGIGKTTLYRKLRQYNTEESTEQGRLFG
jgi:DNA-binding NtrC family response regulator